MLNTGRFSHTATLLADGKVLVTGGFGTSSGDQLASAELYDPATGTWTFTGTLNTARAIHTATLLPDGRVLVAGGFNDNIHLASAELYDPASGTWTVTHRLNQGRYLHTATLLPSGEVLVAGGISDVHSLASAEVYDPVTGTWTLTGRLNTARSNASSGGAREITGKALNREAKSGVRTAQPAGAVRVVSNTKQLSSRARLRR